MEEKSGNLLECDKGKLPLVVQHNLSLLLASLWLIFSTKVYFYGVREAPNNMDDQRELIMDIMKERTLASVLYILFSFFPIMVSIYVCIKTTQVRLNQTH